jgi:hypothetical protein
LGLQKTPQLLEHPHQFLCAIKNNNIFLEVILETLTIFVLAGVPKVMTKEKMIFSHTIDTILKMHLKDWPKTMVLFLHVGLPGVGTKSCGSTIRKGWGQYHTNSMYSMLHLT